MHILGVDVGTTGTKAMAFDENGRKVAQAYQGYKLTTGANGFVEQNADDWLNALLFTVKSCAEETDGDIQALSLSTQGGSMVPVDANRESLCPALSWMDMRSQREAEKLDKTKGSEWFYEKSGWSLSPALNAAKILWLKEHAPNIYHKAWMYLTTLDYLNVKLTGEPVIDPTNAAITQLMNVRAGDWDDEILDAACVSRAQLPTILPPGHVVGALTKKIAETVGLAPGTLVINGAHDQYCSAAGAGALHSGDTILSTGTAWVVLATTLKPHFDSATHIAVGPHVAHGKWGALSSIPTAGVAMEWLREKLGFGGGNPANGILSLQEIDKVLGQRSIYGNGLLFYPYFGGRGFPRNMLDMQASIAGLTLKDDAFDIALAAMEGVVFELRLYIEAYQTIGIDVRNMRMMGGAAKSAFWTDIVANAVGRPLIRLKEPDTACVGAAMLAGVGAGAFAGLENAFSKIGPDGDVCPVNAERKAHYDEKFEKYRRGLDSLENFYMKAGGNPT
ncbi:MAG: FGGY family carbohydrate kinase [Clostridia bacterium]|nr:FGGY family carbohydrate kinase [Clostridia bacterium]